MLVDHRCRAAKSLYRLIVPGVPFRCGSGDDVGNQSIFQHRDFITEAELALFQPRHGDLIASSRRDKRLDRTIEIAMLDSERVQSRHGQ